MSYSWKWFRAGRMQQVSLKCGADIAALAELDRKQWIALSMPTTGVRFDLRMLELMDTDHDGRIRTPEVLAAIDFLKAKNVDFDSLFTAGEAEEKALADVTAKQADLAALAPSDADKKALADWEAQGKTPEVAVAGDATADANAALAAVEPVVDAFFLPPEDMPLVTEEADKVLPLKDHLNPKHLEAILAFAEKCVKPVLGEKDSLTRMEWKKVKGAFAAYRAWVAAKPVMNAGKKGELDDEERVLRYRLHLVEFLENYVNMRRLYDLKELAVFQTGTLRIDAKEMNLCFHVESEAAHSALVEKSNCCVIYLKLSRPSEGATRQICAVVTAGAVAQLYVGRNGVFYDHQGRRGAGVARRSLLGSLAQARRGNRRGGEEVPWRQADCRAEERRGRDAERAGGRRRDGELCRRHRHRRCDGRFGCCGAHGRDLQHDRASDRDFHRRAHPRRVAPERDPHVVQAEEARHRRDPQRVRLGDQPPDALLDEAREGVHDLRSVPHLPRHLLARRHPRDNRRGALAVLSVHEELQARRRKRHPGACCGGTGSGAG